MMRKKLLNLPEAQKTLPQKLKMLRECLGLNHEEFAKIFGSTEKDIVKIETDLTEISTIFFLEVVQFSEISLNEWFEKDISEFSDALKDKKSSLIKKMGKRNENS